MTMKRLILVAVFCSACGSSSSPTAPSAPRPPAPPPAPTTVTITGHVTATNGGMPLAGLSAALGTTTATTDGSGSFSATMLPRASTSLALTGASIVPRTIRIATANSRDVRADAIMLSGGFDLNFYRSLIRNGFEQPGTLQPLRRWTRTPSIYLKTVDEAGEVIHGPTLDLIEATARAAIPEWTSGVLGTPSIERGTGSREGVAGWITIKFPSVGVAGRCGRAQVGVDGGWIELEYHQPPGGNCRVTGAVVAPTAVRHEFGHALGFFHTGDPNDVMSGLTWSNPDKHPLPRELYHARIAYSRPVGNVEPDNDPAGVVNLVPIRVP